MSEKLTSEELDHYTREGNYDRKVGNPYSYVEPEELLRLVAQARLAVHDEEQSAELTALRQFHERAMAAIEASEWMGYIGHDMTGCPDCDSPRDSGHRANCDLAAALTLGREITKP